MQVYVTLLTDNTAPAGMENADTEGAAAGLLEAL